MWSTRAPPEPTADRPHTCVASTPISPRLAQSDPSSGPHLSQIGPTSTPDRSQIGPTSTPGDPGSTETRLRNNHKSTPSTHDLVYPPHNRSTPDFRCERDAGRRVHGTASWSSHMATLTPNALRPPLTTPVGDLRILIIPTTPLQMRRANVGFETRRRRKRAHAVRLHKLQAVHIKLLPGKLIIPPRIALDRPHILCRFPHDCPQVALISPASRPHIDPRSAAN